MTNHQLKGIEMNGQSTASTRSNWRRGTEWYYSCRKGLIDELDYSRERYLGQLEGGIREAVQRREAEKPPTSSEAIIDSVLPYAISLGEILSRYKVYLCGAYLDEGGHLYGQLVLKVAVPGDVLERVSDAAELAITWNLAFETSCYMEIELVKDDGDTCGMLICDQDDFEMFRC